MESLKRVYSNEESLRNFREQTRLAAAKDHVIHAALNDAARQIVANYGPNISLDASKDSLVEIRQGVFSGKVEAQLSVETGSGVKRIAYPIEVRSSKAVLDKDLNVKANIEAALAKTASKEDEEIARKASAYDARIAELNAENEADVKVTALMEEGLSKEAAVAQVFNMNAALKAEAKLDHIQDAGMNNQSNIGINAMPQAYIEIAKTNLPASYGVGDALDIEGVAYECISVEGSFLKFKLKID